MIPAIRITHQFVSPFEDVYNRSLSFVPENVKNSSKLSFGVFLHALCNEKPTVNLPY